MFNKKTLDIEKFKEYCLIVGYFASLFSSTCFFFDAKKVELFGYIVQLPIGLTFFPLTFALCNIVQDRYGKRAANSLVATAFIFDTLLVAAATLMAWLGDRHDYGRCSRTCTPSWPRLGFSWWSVPRSILPCITISRRKAPSVFSTCCCAFLSPSPRQSC
ncbi:VUT family protein [Chromobacterium amazonense]|uniref:VUT family protein n=1 Tax=Chromobacterium amazonense TaxID=1382803 RepID=UPI00237DC0DE|nr:VUT family protein [Chromobacterium amazonense]MDE1716326.1 VUT family protein [Chromobacterium amazonense]